MSKSWTGAGRPWEEVDACDPGTEMDRLRADNERLRGLLGRIVDDRVTHVEGPERWVRLYPEDESQIRAALAGAADQPDAAIPCSSCGQPATAHAVQNGGYVCPPNQPDAAHPNALAGEAGDARLGRIAMRFVDRAGDYCEVDPAERICDEFSTAMGDEIERQWREKMARDAATADNSGAAK